jgi:hypothetical protein
MAKLEKERAQWRCFETEDRPAFGRWLAGTFGKLLTELRENSRRIDEQEGLIEEVEMEMMWGNHRNPRKAYAAVMKRRENPEPEEDFDPQSATRDASGSSKKRAPKGPLGDFEADEIDEEDSDPFDEMGAEIPKEERRAMFDDFLQAVLGLLPKRMPKAEYERMFAQFDADMFGGGSEGNPFVIHDEDEQPGNTGGEARIKEIYRILVRRLHPDLRTDGDVQVSAIWYDVQEAYEARNLDRLETLLALTQMKDGANGGQATVGQMRGALEELKRSLQAIQRSIRQAKHDPSWAFTQKTDRMFMEKSIRREMEASLVEQRQVLDHLKRTLADWSRPWNPLVKKAKKQQKQPSKPVPKRPASKAPSHDQLQAELFAF